MTPTTLTLVDGTRVVVPDALHLITPYVVREQQDWFEDEIRFVRRVVQSGDQVIDIGANYGLYALSLARAAGPQGHVWAYEPASRTAEFLAEGVRANDFGHVTVERSALSDRPGTASLTLHDNAELNALSSHGGGTGRSEAVALVTLDERMDAHGWSDISLVKIDAEGEEANILSGGRRMFAIKSPLVMFEVKAGAELHLELVDAFANQGYGSYRLVPGLGLLVPFDPAEGADGFLLNLFCCKPDRAEQLAARGLLVLATPTAPAPAAQSVHASYRWREVLARTAAGRRLGADWAQRAGDDAGWDRLDIALALHAFSGDASQPAADRAAALRTSLQTLQSLCNGQVYGLRLASLARAAADHGWRGLAVHALQNLADEILRTRSVDPGEPFLCPHERFESVEMTGPPGNWVFASVLEALELRSHFSSFYSGTASLPRLETIASLGFGSAEMARRLTLVRARAAAAR